jgi:peptidyl-prolyl cis-trans isomerase D
MITWMQRHKKWLVITIWISTIAFVGAGFVGWGSYDYGSKGGAVAVVGDREVSVTEYQNEYSNLYNQYSRMFGDQFNQEMADKLKLKNAAYTLVIQKNLILSYADELGLDVTDEEIAKQLVKYEAFKKDGKFDKETYVKVLQQNRTTPTDFEASIKRDLLLQKVESLFNVEANSNEIKNLNELLFSEDEISIEVLNSNDLTVTIKDEDLKNYWNTNKDSYKSEPSVELQIDEISISKKNFSDEEIAKHYNDFKTDYKKEDGKIKTLEEAKADIIKVLNENETRTAALKKYIKLKNGEEKFTQTKNYLEKELPFTVEDNQKILQMVPGDILKPILMDGKYITIKMTNKIVPKTLTFEEAKDMVSKDYNEVAKSIALEKKATELLKEFKGKNIGYVSRGSFDKIVGLNQNEASTFLNKLFSSTEKKGKISIGDKVVLYEIHDTRFATYDDKKDEAVKSTLNNLLNQELMNNLVKNLEKRYEVQSDLKFEE